MYARVCMYVRVYGTNAKMGPNGFNEKHFTRGLSQVPAALLLFTLRRVF